MMQEGTMDEHTLRLMLREAGGEVILDAVSAEDVHVANTNGNGKHVSNGNGNGNGIDVLSEQLDNFDSIRATALRCDAETCRVSPSAVLVRQRATPLGSTVAADARTAGNDDEKGNGSANSNNKGVIEVRVAVVGNVDSGKSTLVGCLTRCLLDDGRGLARSKVFRHMHEAESGRTSSVAQHTLCIDAAGKILNSEGQRAGSEREMVGRASKVITLGIQ